MLQDFSIKSHQNIDFHPIIPSSPTNLFNKLTDFGILREHFGVLVDFTNEIASGIDIICQ